MWVKTHSGWMRHVGMHFYHFVRIISYINDYTAVHNSLGCSRSDYTCFSISCLLLNAFYTGGQKFVILTLISLSLKNKWKNKSKNVCLAKFEVLGSQNTNKLLNIMSISDPQITLNRLGCVKQKIQKWHQKFGKLTLILLFLKKRI